MEQELFAIIDSMTRLSQNLIDQISQCETMDDVDLAAARCYNVGDSVFYIFDPVSRTIHYVSAEISDDFHVRSRAEDDVSKMQLYQSFVYDTEDPSMMFYNGNDQIPNEVVHAFFYNLIQ